MNNDNSDIIKNVEDVFSQRRAYWMNIVTELNNRLYKVEDLVDLQTVIYVYRQEAIENYHNLSATLAKKAKKFKEDSARIYKEIRLMKTSPGASSYMFSTEASIREQIDSQLSSDKYLIDIMENHLNYIDNTIKTLDGIIFAISNRIKIEEIKIGR